MQHATGRPCGFALCMRVVDGDGGCRVNRPSRHPDPHCHWPDSIRYAGNARPQLHVLGNRYRPQEFRLCRGGVLLRGHGQPLRRRSARRRRRQYGPMHSHCKCRHGEHPVQVADESDQAYGPVQVQWNGRGRMDQCHERVRHPRMVAQAEGVLPARGLRSCRGVGAKRRSQQFAQRSAQLESDSLRLAQRERWRRADRRRSVLRHLLASGRGDSQRSRRSGRVAGPGGHWSRRIAIRGSSRRVRQCRSLSRPRLQRHHHVRGRRDHLQQRGDDAGHESAERDGVCGADERDLHAAAGHRQVPHVAGCRHVAFRSVLAPVEGGTAAARYRATRAGHLCDSRALSRGDAIHLCIVGRRHEQMDSLRHAAADCRTDSC